MPEADLFGEPMESLPCAKSGRVAMVMAPKLIRAQVRTGKRMLTRRSRRHDTGPVQKP
jgi:hypothetical protein